ncbi:flavin reductase family protein [Bradyrhizobium yuanmingense]|uniref:flavin reductase family protein n=1 Tax=Bradyrhizobium TaxID=374 RepID=UPI00187D23D1|nr:MULTISPECIES: flavin reductase family protein [Bradyrhizobium]MCA1390298.1 flavin reductase family protein [Bradyrhizobium sp. IC3123]MCA1527587.1 flavin reductase family protein [Bradyrhizobium yuanmingense]UWU85510.1 flavin reductase family protein [Bradyrhizobium sp. CB1024]
MTVDGNSFDANHFKQAMRQCAGAVALVTVGAEHGRRTGLTVTSACSLSDKPPSLIVCVNRNASAHARIREEGAFAINFLHEDHALLALTFSGQKGVDGDDRFAFGQWTRGVTGAPVLADAVAAFDCVLAQEFETTTHSIFVGEVRSASHSAAVTPLVYLRSNFHTPRELRENVTIGDLDARHLSWTDFS